MVSGMGTPSLQVPFTNPPALRKLILSKCPGYAIGPPYDRGRGTVAKFVRRMAKARTKAALLLMDEFDPDLLLVVYRATDIVQHLYWRDFFEPGSEGTEEAYADLLPKIYEIADAGLGMLIERMGPDVPVLVVSDHGAQALELVVGMNRFLAEKGYLTFFPGDRPPAEVGLQKAIKGVIRNTALGIQRALPMRVKEHLKRVLPGLSGKLSALWHVPDMSAVDFSRTRAFAVGSYGSIFLNLKGREPLGTVEPGRQYEELCDEISAVLLEWVGPDGNRVVDRVQRREELYEGPFVERAPDLIIRLMPNHFTRTSFAPEKEKLFERRTHPLFAQQYQSIHAMYGICIASGHPFRQEEEGKQESVNSAKGKRIEGARIIDLAPTILHVMGLDVPDDMDGVTLEGLFDPQWYASNPPRVSKGPPKGIPTAPRKLSPEEEEKLKDELQGLGYIQ
jgi:predicted AlkP superfamily phosphohydrolase/phosphomutase